MGVQDCTDHKECTELILVGGISLVSKLVVSELIILCLLFTDKQ